MSIAPAWPGLFLCYCAAPGLDIRMQPWAAARAKVHLTNPRNLHPHLGRSLGVSKLFKLLNN